MTRINITDDMIERAADCLFGKGWKDDGDPALFYVDVVRGALEAALDRRTGPKDRRVEINDMVPPGLTRRLFNYHGRRDGDRPWVLLPRKSDRLKREAEEREKQKAQEIHVSEGMVNAGYRAFLTWENENVAGRGSMSATIYRAMRLQEMKERGGA